MEKDITVKSEEIRLFPVNFSSFRVKVKGKSPLLMDKMPNEVLEEIEAKKRGSKRIKSREITKDQEIERAVHYLPDGSIGFPAMGFKAGIIEATGFFGRSIYKKEAKGIQIMNVTNGLVPLVFKSREVCNRPIKNSNGLTNTKFSPQFNDWEAELEITYDANVLSAQDIVTLLNYAGHHIGVGSWSPRSRCGGNYGMYEVVISDEE